MPKIDVLERAENALSSIENEAWYQSGAPWSDAMSVYSGSDDPHAGTLIAICDPSLFLSDLDVDIDEPYKRFEANTKFISNAPDLIRELVAEVKAQRGFYTGLEKQFQDNVATASRLQNGITELRTALELALAIVDRYQRENEQLRADHTASHKIRLDLESS